MSLLTPTLLALLRATLVALAASGLAVFARSRGRTSALMWPALITFLIPGMLAGYTLSTPFRTRVAGSWSVEILYTLFVFLRLAPVALLALSLVPPATSDAGRHCFRLGPQLAWGTRILWEIRSLGKGPLLTAGFVFLLAFQEFDLATCWGLHTWTVALFDAQAGGLALSESLRLAALPLGVELIIVLALAAGLRGASSGPELQEQPTRRDTFAVCFAMGACLLVAFLPLARLLTQSWSGFPLLLENFALAREIGNSILLAFVAALAAAFLARWAVRKHLRILVLALPGLLGSLLLTLLILALFQLPGLRALYGGPLAVLLALTLQLLPVAFFLEKLLALHVSPTALHTARLTRAWPVVWQLARRPRLLAGTLLFCAAYADFTANSLLAPPELTSAFTRIFNLMHYGQSATLSAMLVVTLAVPLLLLALLLAGLRLYPRCHAR